METTSSRRALAVLLFAVGWTALNWPVLSWLADASLTGAYWHLTGWWFAALAALFVVSRGGASPGGGKPGKMLPAADSTACAPKAAGDNGG
ncbi:hypothetical protein ASZ90_000427 [hydrocarbon metagenome]|uniref:Uncharacterized protein n=1 Tax=hydrocarbon metagenome TaxID=938273 RepID=A0A0W8G980_9ZZZZ